MPHVEESSSCFAAKYERPLRFTYDRNLRDGGGFRYTFSAGEVRCSELGAYESSCRLAPGDMNALGRPDLGFIYLDAGLWGGKEREYSFGMVSGRDVYLCQYIPGEQWSDDMVPDFRNQSVDEFVTQMWALNCGIKVLGYAEIPNPQPGTVQDRRIYLLIPDFHMPPISWYVQSREVSALGSSGYRNPPDWMMQTAAFQRNPYFYCGMYGIKTLRQKQQWHDADIFLDAGIHLVRFCRALSRLNETTRKLLHVISMGDTFELWLSRDYQFEPGSDLKPRFAAGGLRRTADWAMEVMLWNAEVMEALHILQSAGLAEVVYLWGNHDAYLMQEDLCAEVGIPNRVSSYTGLNGDLHIEHGHRFDSSNYDNISASDGPRFANWAYYFPAVRKAEPIGRGVHSITSGEPDERDCYFMGASILFLHQKFHLQQSPFRVFCMGHTHQRWIRRFSINGRYSLWGKEQ